MWQQKETVAAPIHKKFNTRHKYSIGSVVFELNLPSMKGKRKQSDPIINMVKTESVCISRFNDKIRSVIKLVKNYFVYFFNLASNLEIYMTILKRSSHPNVLRLRKELNWSVRELFWILKTIFYSENISANYLITCLPMFFARSQTKDYFPHFNPLHNRSTYEKPLNSYHITSLRHSLRWGLDVKM